jgi:threonine/homoserine/homoserine lactone efflux protein
MVIPFAGKQPGSAASGGCNAGEHLLVFLLVDTLLEAFEVSAALPEVCQGVPLVLFAAFLTWLGIAAMSARREEERCRSR